MAPLRCLTLLTVPGSISDGSQTEDMVDFPAGNEEANKPGWMTRSEREENLRSLMNDDGDNNISKPMKAETDEDPSTETAEEQPQEELAASTIASGARRRSRRKIMKKKMLKDEEGYLGLFPLESIYNVAIYLQ
ncbi:MAG: hypothetical protein Q9216_001761 [Gyalolechia sp. 2 TL-2023]